MLRPIDYFDLSDPHVTRIFGDAKLVWQPIAEIAKLTASFIEAGRRIRGTVDPLASIGEGLVVIEEGAIVEPGAHISAPAYIGRRAVVRQGAYLRPYCIILEEAIVGHATEIKSSILLPGAQAPHFAYVGDSILGSRVNLGAGTKLSNIPITVGFRNGMKTRKTIQFEVDGEVCDTGMRKLGAILGDEVQTGCNSVLSPGTLVGKRTLIYPNMTVPKGLYPSDVILKLRQTTDIVLRQDTSR